MTDFNAGDRVVALSSDPGAAGSSYGSAATLEHEGSVVRPEHYVSHPSGVEPITITKHESFLRGNILKYVMRAPYKGRELDDMKKARQYLDWEIKRLEES